MVVVSSTNLFPCLLTVFLILIYFIACGKKYQITFYTGSQDGAGTHLPVPVNLVMEGKQQQTVLTDLRSSAKYKEKSTN